MKVFMCLVFLFASSVYADTAVIDPGAELFKALWHSEPYMEATVTYEEGVMKTDVMMKAKVDCKENSNAAMNIVPNFDTYDCFRDDTAYRDGAVAQLLYTQIVNAYKSKAGELKTLLKPDSKGLNNQFSVNVVIHQIEMKSKVTYEFEITVL